MASMATTSAAKRPRSMPQSVWATSGNPPASKVARKISCATVFAPKP